MKKKIKILNQLLILGIVFMLSSCEKDLYEDALKESKINVEQISLKNQSSKVIINQKLYDAVSKLKRKNVNGKIVFDSANNIYFDDEKGIKISKEDYESYTFKIINENEKLENLFFSKNKFGGFDVFKVKYDFTEEQIKYLNSQDIKPTEIISLSELQNTNKMVYITFIASACSHWPWDCHGEVCGFEEITFSMWVEDVNGGGGTSSGGYNGNGGESGTGGISGGGIGTSNSSQNGYSSSEESTEVPMMTLPVHNIQPSPCAKMKTLLADSNLKGRLNTLKAAAENWSFEDIFIVNPNPSPTPNNSYTFVETKGTIDNPTADWAGTTAMQGMIHSHFDGLLSIFSPTDLQSIYQIMSNQNVTDDFFYGVVTKAGTKYVITMDNRATFLAFGAKYLSSDDKTKDFDVDVWQGKYDIKVGNGMGDHNEKAFTKMMNELNMGINLFSLSSDCSTSQQIKYVALNSVVGSVQPINCN